MHTPGLRPDRLFGMETGVLLSPRRREQSWQDVDPAVVEMCVSGVGSAAECLILTEVRLCRPSAGASQPVSGDMSLSDRRRRSLCQDACVVAS